METQENIRVLLADDHPIVREGLAAIIGRQPDMTVVGEAGNGRELVDEYGRVLPNVTIVDLRMPEMDGLQAIRMIRSRSPGARVIVLTTYDDDEDIYRSLRAGAQAYLMKDAPRADLVEAIRAVHEGEKRIPYSVASKLAGRVNGPELTQREMEVLTLIAAGKQNKEIATTLFISYGTVKAHINSILNKLNVSDRTQAVTAALKRGLIRVD